MNRVLRRMLTVETLNPLVRAAQYAVRGELVLRAGEYQRQLDAGSKLPFKEIILCNIGNPQSVGQKPVSFFRQVMSLLENDDLRRHPLAAKMFAQDAIDRAEHLAASTPGGIGAYSHSAGLEVVRSSVARFIERRDGHPSDINDLFLSDGATPAIKNLLQLIIRSPKDGILIPIPQYPLYSGSIALLGGTQVGYYLDEEARWGLQPDELERAVKSAKSDGIEPRALVVINPGNPTGAVLDRSNMEQVVDFCAKHKLILLADEVYQENIYRDGSSFTSFKKVVMESPHRHAIELASFHSVSKGFLGECGHRGGYAELYNFDADVKAEYYKLFSMCLCSNVPGQMMVELMTNPPKPGDASFKQYEAERDAILASLKARAVKLSKAFRTMEGVSCNDAEGAMYLFPQITLPSKAVEAAKANKRAPDTQYCIELLDATGICVVPGSGFQQRNGTYHFRTTFLPPPEAIDSVIQLMSDFHAAFMAKYRS